MRRNVVGPTTEDTAGSASTAVVSRSSPRSTSGSTAAPGAVFTQTRTAFSPETCSRKKTMSRWMGRLGST